MKQNCVTSKDKMKHVVDIKEKLNVDNNEKSMYIGDSVMDLLASLQCDIQVWINTESNGYFLNLLTSFSRLVNHNNNEIFIVDTW